MKKYANVSVYGKIQNSLYTSRQGKFKKKIRTTLLLVVAFVFIQALIFFTYEILQNLGILLGEEGTLKIGLGDVIVSLIAAIAVVYQLGQVRESEQRSREIEEANFILQFNQSFIQDDKICRIEELLEMQMLGEVDGAIFNLENRQSLVNYLVYLEGLSALVNRNVLALENIDNLFAYRYFLAMNNEEVQKNQLFKYADYYRGCFKLYALWKSYREEHNLPILQHETSLDKWLYFKNYINCGIIIRKCNEEDSCKRIAEIIYQVDNYIYPTAFGTVANAEKILRKLIEEKNGIFSRENIRLAIYDDEIVGVGIVLASDNIDFIKDDFIEKFSIKRSHFADVCEKYFNVLVQKNYSNTPYLLCLGVDSSYQNKGIGSLLLGQLLLEHKEKQISLHVLKEYDDKSIENPAIKLYQKYGFKCKKETKGYAFIADNAPDCIEMELGER